MTHTVRIATVADLPAVQAALAQALDWRGEGGWESPEEFIDQMGHAYLLAEWGRAGDTAVVAEVDGQAVGAAWYRYWTDSSHSYGYVDDSIPEVGIGVEPGSRACGVGMSLMIRLLEQAAGQGVRCVSLSVARDNAAASLYRRLGFERYADVESSWTMLKRLGS